MNKDYYIVQINLILITIMQKKYLIYKVNL